MRQTQSRLREAQRERGRERIEALRAPCLAWNQILSDSERNLKCEIGKTESGNSIR